MFLHFGQSLVSVNSLVVVFDVGVGSAAGLGVGVVAGVVSGEDIHPEIPIVATAPAIARDLRNFRHPIFMGSSME